MPSFEHVTYNSSRVQRAFRINNIEELKLKGKLHLLDKERIHRQRITNQEIRLISLTLDFIHASSGHSTEGLSPESQDDEEKKPDGPCFLYGERVISRKKRRNLRPQSAFEQTGSAFSGSVSPAFDTVRPLSSPVRSRHTFITSLKDNVSITGDDGNLSVPSRSDASSPQPAWAEEPSDVTKILLRANANVSQNNKRQSIFKRDKNVSAFKSMTRNLRIISAAESQSHLPDRLNNPRSSLSPVSGNRPNVNEILSQSRSTMSARAWKSHLNRRQASPVAISSQRQFIIDSRKEANRSKSAIIQTRIKEFINN